MPRIPVTVQTSQPVGSTNQSVVTGRSLAPTNIRQLGPAQPREQSPSRQFNRAQSAQNQAYRKSVARYDSDQMVIPQVSFPANTQVSVPHRLTDPQTNKPRPWVGCALVTPIGGGLSYSIAHNVPASLDAHTILITNANSITADVVIW